jgi:hypothetical protein
VKDNKFITRRTEHNVYGPGCSRVKCPPVLLEKLGWPQGKELRCKGGKADGKWTVWVFSRESLILSFAPGRLRYEDIFIMLGLLRIRLYINFRFNLTENTGSVHYKDQVVDAV